MAAAKKVVGIIGFGNFGAFMAAELARYCEVLVYDRRSIEADIKAAGARPATLEELGGCDVIIPSVPARNLPDVLERIVRQVKPGALVVDVCSVKVQPVEWMLDILPNGVDIIATHPLFGPQSGASGLAGHKIVTWPVRVSDERYGALKRFLINKMELVVIEMSPDEHDREMAYVQALTFYLGRGLDLMNIPRSPLATNTFQHLLEIRDIVAGDSQELFETIQLYNKYADEVRQELRETLRRVEGDLEVVASNSYIERK